jgi:ankyrin repeat protein
LAAGDVDQRCEDGWTALTHAAASGQVKVMKLLLKAKAYVDTSGKDGTTPLMAAAQFSQRKAVALLLGAGARPDLTDKSGETALAKVCFPPYPPGTPKSVYAAIARSLLAAKSDPNLANDGGWTPLATAVSSGNEGIVEALLKAKADPNVKTLKGGRTPLWMARVTGNKKIIELLRAAGAKD